MVIYTNLSEHNSTNRELLTTAGFYSGYCRHVCHTL